MVLLNSLSDSGSGMDMLLLIFFSILLIMPSTSASSSRIALALAKLGDVAAISSPSCELNPRSMQCLLN